MAKSKSDGGPRGDGTGSKPWDGNGFWIGIQALLVWSGVCVVLLFLDLEKGKSDSAVNAWIWFLLLVPWATFAVRNVWLRVSPPDASRWDTDGEVWRQCKAMVIFALERGHTPETADIDTVHKYDPQWHNWNTTNKDRVPELRLAHKRLSSLVAPAMPKTLVLIADTNSQTKRRDDFAWLGSVGVAKAMLGLAVGLLPVFIALALVKGTSLDSSEGLFQNQGFTDSALTAIYLLVASALGAAFAGLFKVRKYVENLSYDDQYESSYWVRFVLGLVAGLILSVSLSTLLPLNQDQEFRITLPILALVGGFSSDLVYRILERLIDAIETLIDGSASEKKETAKIESDARLKVQEARADQTLQEVRLREREREIDLVLTLLRELRPEDAALVRTRLEQHLTTLVEDQEQDGERAGTPEDGQVLQEASLEEWTPDDKQQILPGEAFGGIPPAGQEPHLTLPGDRGGAAGNGAPAPGEEPQTLEPDPEGAPNEDASDRDEASGKV